LMLETSFERLLGDIGNPQSFGFSVQYRTVRGAFAHRVIDHRFDQVLDFELLEAFVREALVLESEGAAVITTSCGFMFAYQEAIQARLRVPFVSSSLLWLVPNPLGISYSDIARLNRKPQPVGILTFDLPAFKRLEPILTQQFDEKNIELFVQGMPGEGNFVSVIRSNQPSFDTGQCAKEISASVQKLIERANKPLSAVILECTNLSPYSALIEQQARCPVLDLNRLVQRFFNS
jgi:hypothetical protein